MLTKSADKMRKKFFTEDGEKALFKRLETLIDIYENNDSNFPFSANMLGFVPLVIRSREGLLDAINELRQILGLKSVSLVVNDNGRKQIINIGE